jgi:hypothetical protein
MKGNFQVRFLEGGGLATARFHSAEPCQAEFWICGTGSTEFWSTTIIPFPGDNYNLPVVLGLICSSHVGVWFGVCPLGGTESSAPSGAEDAVEPKGQTVAFLFPCSRCLAFWARTLSPLNSKIKA